MQLVSKSAVDEKLRTDLHKALQLTFKTHRTHQQGRLQIFCWDARPWGSWSEVPQWGQGAKPWWGSGGREFRKFQRAAV